MLCVYVCIIPMYVCMLCVYVRIIRMYVCMLCVYVCIIPMYVCMLCVYVRIIRMYVCMLCVYVCIISMYVCMLCVYVCIIRMYVCMLCVYVCIIRMYVCMLCVHVCIICMYATYVCMYEAHMQRAALLSVPNHTDRMYLVSTRPTEYPNCIYYNLQPTQQGLLQSEYLCLLSTHLELFPSHNVVEELPSWTELLKTAIQCLLPTSPATPHTFNCYTPPHNYSSTHPQPRPHSPTHPPTSKIR